MAKVVKGEHLVKYETFVQVHVCTKFILYEGHPIKNEAFFIVRKSVCVFS